MKHEEKVESPKVVDALAMSEHPKQRVQLIITLEENGNISVNGPIENEMLCDWMMKQAEKATAEYRAHQAALAARKPPTLINRMISRIHPKKP